MQILAINEQNQTPLFVVNVFYGSLLGAVSSRSEQTFQSYWLIYAAATVIWPYHVGYYFQSMTSTLIPCTVDRADIIPLNGFCHTASVLQRV